MKNMFTRVITTPLQLVIILNYFVFNHHHYLQITGYAMATKCAPRRHESIWRKILLSRNQQHETTPFIFYKNPFYKNHEAQNHQKIKTILRIMPRLKVSNLLLFFFDTESHKKRVCCSSEWALSWTVCS